MPRPPDPTALSETEARELRDLITHLRARTGITAEDMAAALEPGPNRDLRRSALRRITNAMSESRTLLAKNAADLFQSINPGREHPTAQRLKNRYWDRQAEKSGWLLRYLLSQDVPAVLIEPHSIPQLAEFLTNRLADLGAIAKTQAAHDRVAPALERVLKAEAPRMARGWRASSIGRILSFRRRRWNAADVTASVKGLPDGVVSDLITLIEKIAFPNTKEDKTKA